MKLLIMKSLRYYLAFLPLFILLIFQNTYAQTAQQEAEEMQAILLQINYEVMSLKAERDKLRDAAKKVLWKLERKEQRWQGSAIVDWARIDRNDATINELRRAVEGE